MAHGQSQYAAQRVVCVQRVARDGLQGEDIARTHLLALEDLEQVLNDSVVKILAAKMGVARGGEYLEDTLVNCEE